MPRHASDVVGNHSRQMWLARAYARAHLLAYIAGTKLIDIELRNVHPGVVLVECH